MMSCHFSVCRVKLNFHDSQQTVIGLLMACFALYYNSVSNDRRERITNKKQWHMKEYKGNVHVEHSTHRKSLLAMNLSVCLLGHTQKKATEPKQIK